MRRKLQWVVVAGWLLVGIAGLVGAEEQSAPTSVQDAMTRLTESKGPNAFFGHYEYMVILPHGYGAAAEFADPERLVELVHFAPARTVAAYLQGDLASQFEEQQYGSLGIVRLEVTPKQHPRLGDKPVPFEAFRQAIPATLQERGETFTVKEVPLVYPAFEVHITAPQELIQVFIEGRKVVYVFTAGRDDDVLRGLLDSLKEL